MPETRSVAVVRRRLARLLRRLGRSLARWGGHLDARLSRSGERLRARWAATTPSQRRTGRLAAGAVAVGVAFTVTAVAVAGPWDTGQRRAERQAQHPAGEPGGEERPPTPEPGIAPSAAPVLAALSGPSSGHREAARGQAPTPTRSGLAKALRSLLRDPALGRVSAVSVVDVATGKPLYGVQATTAAIPASTVKLATATAVLAALGPDHRIATQTRLAGRQVVLVGGGDSTLTVNQLAALAEDTARTLRAGGHTEVSLRYDDRLFTGPDLHPIGPNENIAPVSALTVNAGRLDDSTRGPAPRATDPAERAADTFAAGLRKHGVRVSGDPSRATSAEARRATAGERLAVHQSAPLPLLVERMLMHSDNDLAEALARQTALAAGQPASFDGAGAAVRAQLAELDLPLSGARFADGSGLDRDDRMTAELLTALLALAADPDRPQLRSVLTGLPVAGFNGTLSRRYPDSAAGAGLVRAKTGTLSGVNSLAGTVVDADGRLLAFAALSNGSRDGAAAQTALDRLASTLSGCGCR